MLWGAYKWAVKGSGKTHIVSILRICIYPKPMPPAGPTRAATPAAGEPPGALSGSPPGGAWWGDVLRLLTYDNIRGQDGDTPALFEPHEPRLPGASRGRPLHNNCLAVDCSLVWIE